MRVPPLMLSFRCEAERNIFSSGSYGLEQGISTTLHIDAVAGMTYLVNEYFVITLGELDLLDLL